MVQAEAAVENPHPRRRILTEFGDFLGRVFAARQFSSANVEQFYPKGSQQNPEARPQPLIPVKTLQVVASRRFAEVKPEVAEVTRDLGQQYERG